MAFTFKRARLKYAYMKLRASDLKRGADGRIDMELRKQSFAELNNKANEIKNSQKCPAPVKLIIDKVQWAFSYMTKLNNPQPGQQGQGAGSMCNIF